MSDLRTNAFDRGTHHADIVQVDGEIQKSFDAHHTIVCLTNDDGLPRKQPVELVRETGTALPFRTGLSPVAFPSHDLCRVGEHASFKANQQRSIQADNVGEIGSPGIENSGGSIPVGLVLGDVPHQGVLPGGPSICCKRCIVAARSAADDWLRTLHDIGAQGVFVGAESFVRCLPWFLFALDIVTDTLEIVVSVPKARMDKLARSFLGAWQILRRDDRAYLKDHVSHVEQDGLPFGHGTAFGVPLSAGTLDVNASAAMANKHRIAMIS